jgi:hypothetical protein
LPSKSKRALISLVASVGRQHLPQHRQADALARQCGLAGPSRCRPSGGSVHRIGRRNIAGTHRCRRRALAFETNAIPLILTRQPGGRLCPERTSRRDANPIGGRNALRALPHPTPEPSARFRRPTRWTSTSNHFTNAQRVIALGSVLHKPYLTGAPADRNPAVARKRG